MTENMAYHGFIFSESESLEGGVLYAKKTDPFDL